MAAGGVSEDEIEVAILLDVDDGDGVGVDVREGLCVRCEAAVAIATPDVVEAENSLDEVDIAVAIEVLGGEGGGPV